MPVPKVPKKGGGEKERSRTEGGEWRRKRSDAGQPRKDNPKKK